MASLWVVRAGRHGEMENYNIENNIVAIGWSQLGSVAEARDRNSLKQLIAEAYPDKPPGTVGVWAGEIWSFCNGMREGDFVALPLRNRSVVAFGRIAGPYRFDAEAPIEARHQRSVVWLRPDFPRSEIDPEIRSKLALRLTVFQVRHPDAVDRVGASLEGRIAPPAAIGVAGELPTELLDIEERVRDEITAAIRDRFRDHDLSRLVADVLRAQGYKTQESPPGADGGVDILAGCGPMGFDSPRLCVQVKARSSSVDVTVYRELKGVMQAFHAEQGLIVSWGDFTAAVRREARQDYFKIRLWDAGTLVDAILEHYEKLSDEIQAELPLKRVWTLVQTE